MKNYWIIIKKDEYKILKWEKGIKGSLYVRII